jgi:redox-sensitive bicupin YhaK (pirin superfamily)
MSIRGAAEISAAIPSVDGAGVMLRRAFGFGKTGEFDPFLLFDDFRGDHPDDYRRGFPWHPHRGIETITYLLAGEVEHRDSLGNQGLLKPGDLQWMTAGHGIIHQEMPIGDAQGRMHGFQLWANLPASHKMDRPRYQDIASAEVPEITEDDGTRIRVLCGSHGGRTGPVEGLAVDPCYLDVAVPAGRTIRLPVETDRHAFAYVFEGSGSFPAASGPLGVLTEDVSTERSRRARPVANRHLVRFDRGDEIVVCAGESGLRFLLATGRPLGEPVAWHGPIVMNMADEIRQALSDLADGSFAELPG